MRGTLAFANSYSLMKTAMDSSRSQYLVADDAVRHNNLQVASRCCLRAGSYISNIIIISLTD